MVTTSVYEQVREVVMLLMQRPITEEIAMRVGEIPGFEHLEIVDGVWVGFEENRLMGGEEHGWIKSILITLLTTWVLENKAGRVYPGDTDFVLSGGRGELELVRRPDVAFVLDRKVRPSKGLIYVSPDLVIEIISPSERPGAIRAKLQEYMAHGVQQVWQVYPDNQEIVVNQTDGSAKTYRAGDTIPGFTLDVAQMFEL